MPGRPIGGVLALGALLVGLSGCGGSAGASQSASAAGAPSSPPASVATSSIAIPSFVLPSAEIDMRALLPDQICGTKADKQTISGDEAVTGADEDFKAILRTLGKQPSDVVVTTASSSGTGSRCSAGFLQIKGADQGLYEQTFFAVEQTSGHPYASTTVGGESVHFCRCPGGLTYVSFLGDAMVFTVVQDEANAAAIIQQLP